MVIYINMKPKEPKPYSARDTSGKYEHAAPLPQWLKTLEERYQRIHEKILCTPSPKARYSKDGRLLRPKTRMQIPKSKPTSGTPADIEVSEHVGQTHTGDTKNDDNNNVVSLTPDKEQPVNIPTGNKTEPQDITKLIDFRESSLNGPRGAMYKGSKNLNTSASRVSGKTSKSCPATITNTKPFTRVHLHRSRTTENLNPLSKRHSQKQMSLEAKNILEDMFPDTMQNENIGDKTVEHIPNIVFSERRDAFDEVTIEHTDANNRDCNEHLLGPKDNTSDKDYLTCSGGSRFPEIQSESSRLKALYQLRQMQCRVPGVGKYEISVDNVDGHFEITPPGFDVRYTTVTKEPHEILEVPPPEIKAQAIAKCTDWLTRCTSSTTLKGDT